LKVTHTIYNINLFFGVLKGNAL